MLTCNNLVNILNNYPSTIGTDFEIANDLYQRYNEPHRHWHGISHIDYLLKHIPENVEGEGRENITLAILFHDSIYNVTKHNNEERSANLFLQWYPKHPKADEIADAIVSTKTGKTTSPLSQLLNDLDRSILQETDFEKLKKYEMAISKEYLSKYTKKDYLKSRIEFLLTQDNSKLHKLANWIKNKNTI